MLSLKIPRLVLQAPPAPGFLAAIQPLGATVLFQRGVCRLELLSNSVEDSPATVWISLPWVHSVVTHLPCVFWLLPSPTLSSLTLRVYVPLVLYCHFGELQKGEEIRNTCASFPWGCYLFSATAGTRECLNHSNCVSSASVVELYLLLSPVLCKCICPFYNILIAFLLIWLF